MIMSKPVLGMTPNEVSFTTLPIFAITTGVAKDNQGNRVGVYGSSVTNVGVYAESAQDVGIYATGGRLAASLEGNVEILAGQLTVNGNIICRNGDIRIANADCAEDFDIIETEHVEPGTVMVFGEDGSLRPSYQAYDRRVAGVISGAGDYQPGIVLDKQVSERRRQPIALMGKVYCKVDASYAPIRIGDLLTTSPTTGHAMTAFDSAKAFGTVIGKAIQALRAGQGLIPVLVALQ